MVLVTPPGGDVGAAEVGRSELGRPASKEGELMGDDGPGDCTEGREAGERTSLRLSCVVIVCRWQRLREPQHFFERDLHQLF